MKTVLVTGGSTGIGSSIVERFAKENYNVVFTYNNNYEKACELQEEVISKYNVKCMTIKCDLKNEDEINNLVNLVYKEFNNIDVLVNNAALELTTEFTNKTKQDFIDVLNVNLVGPFLLSRLVGNKMFENKEGKIINISSNNALDKYDPSTLEYDASKAGLISLTHNLSLQYAPYVNVNAVCPGWINSDKVKKLNEELDGMLESEESKKILKQRFGECEEVADLVFFLVQANYINNEIIRIDGGVM